MRDATLNLLAPIVSMLAFIVVTVEPSEKAHVSESPLCNPHGCWMHFRAGLFQTFLSLAYDFFPNSAFLEDLRKLGQLRGGINEGERMRHLFLAS